MPKPDRPSKRELDHAQQAQLTRERHTTIRVLGVAAVIAVAAVALGFVLAGKSTDAKFVLDAKIQGLFDNIPRLMVDVSLLTWALVTTALWRASRSKSIREASLSYLSQLDEA